MGHHVAMQEGNVAVITGGANGIGLAAAKKYASFGMKVCIADRDQDALGVARAEILDAGCHDADLLALEIDVSQLADIQALRDKVYATFSEVHVLMNNAGTSAPHGAFTNYDAWQKTINVNLWGVINGIHTFVPSMIEQKTPGLVINTGSKQGITCPPGNPAYNVTKAGIKVTTEALQHEFRNLDGCQLTAHLLVPGFTYTGMMRKRLPEKPAAAWEPEQVIDYMLEAVDRGDFYIICPDNEVSTEMDNKRILWGAQDITENRPPLSRWHPDYKQAFEKAE